MRRKAEGHLLLREVVRKDGSVGDIEIVKPFDIALEQTGILAASQWQFRPALLDGEPVDVWVTLDLRFTLR